MPKGPKGEKRPADVIGNAVHVMRIATGEIEKDVAGSKPPLAPLSVAFHDSSPAGGYDRFAFLPVRGSGHVESYERAAQRV